MRAVRRLVGEITAYWGSFALAQALRVRLFDVLEESRGQSLDRVAAAVDLPVEQMRSLLAAFAEMGFVVLEDGIWRLRAEFSPYLLSASAYFLGDWLLSLCSEGAWDSWHTESQGGRSHAGQFGALDNDVARARARGQIGRVAAATLTAYLRDTEWFGQCRTVHDLGCGTGEYLKALASYLPLATCVGIDNNREAVESFDGPANCRLVHGDLFDPPSLNPADLILLSNVVHEFADHEVVTLLAAVRGRLALGGRVVLHHDHIDFGDRGHRTFMHLASVHLAVSRARGRVRSGDELASLIGAAGLRVADRAPLGLMEALIGEAIC